LSSAEISTRNTIEVRGLRTQFDDFVVHDNLDLDVHTGEILGVVGGSGTGKSVLMRAIIGLKRPSAGTVKVFDQDSYATRLTYYDPQTGQLRSAGFIPLFANSWFYMFTCMNDAQLISEDGTRCTMDNRRAVEALQFMTDCYDALGGMKVAQAFTADLISGPLDIFLTGKVAMRIDSDEYLKLISAYGPDMSFGVVGAPIPEKRLAEGQSRAGWMGGWSYAIPATAKEKEAAWELMRWLCSVEANQLMANFEASLARAQGQVYFPYSHPDRRIMNWLR